MPFFWDGLWLWELLALLLVLPGWGVLVSSSLKLVKASGMGSEIGAELLVFGDEAVDLIEEIGDGCIAFGLIKAGLFGLFWRFLVLILFFTLLVFIHDEKPSSGLC